MGSLVIRTNNVSYTSDIDDDGLLSLFRQFSETIEAGKPGLWLDISGEATAMLWVPTASALEFHFDLPRTALLGEDAPRLRLAP